MCRKLIATALGICLIYVLLPSLSRAAPPQQAPNGEEYTVQGGDWLTKIADKYYGNPQEYPVIIEATNARAAQDNSFAVITNPDLIRVGQKLWIPGIQSQLADIITINNISFKPVSIEELGIQAVVPNHWPAVEADDPLLQHAWSAGLFTFVSFTTTPGNDALVGLARVLGVARDDLTQSFIGGQLIEEQVGNHIWTIYTRDEGGVTTSVAATVQDKVIYTVNLFSESSQTLTILSAIINNFEIADPTAAQQTITIESPAPGSTLTNPFELRGKTNQYPFKGRLIYRVLDAEGNQVGRSPFTVVGQVGNPATFAIPATYDVNTDGLGTVEVAEISAADGAIITIDSVAVMLLDDSDGYEIIIDDPRPFASISSPVQIRGKTGNRPFEGRLNYRIIDAAGQEISQGAFLSRGQVGQINAFDEFVEFSVAKDGPGRIEIFNIRPADGAVFAIGSVNVWLTALPLRP